MLTMKRDPTLSVSPNSLREHIKPLGTLCLQQMYPKSPSGKQAGIGGLKGPSQLPLTVKGWTALQSVVLREYEQEIIFELLQIGVTDIVVNRDIPLIMT